MRMRVKKILAVVIAVAMAAGEPGIVDAAEISADAVTQEAVRNISENILPVSEDETILEMSMDAASDNTASDNIVSYNTALEINASASVSADWYNDYLFLENTDTSEPMSLYSQSVGTFPSGNYIVIAQYTGSASDVYVPKEATINGTTYQTILSGGVFLNSNVKTISIENGVLTGKSCFEMFGDCYNLEEINVNALDTSHTENMAGLFLNCVKLKTIDMAGLDTRCLENMTEMFQNCSNAVKINIKGLNTANVQNMNSMFYGCSSLETLDLTGLNTSNVNDMGLMFYECSKLSNLNLDMFSTGKVQSMNNMFEGCEKLSSLDVSQFNTANVKTMFHMFYGCSSLKNIIVDNFNTANVTNMCGMFGYCSNLTNLELNSFDVNLVQDMSAMFISCSSLTDLDLNSFATVNTDMMPSMFCGCSGLTSLKMTNFVTDNVTDMQSMFSGCSSLKSLDLHGWNACKVQYMQSMFRGCSSLETLNLTGFKTHDTKSLQLMFSNCEKIKTLDLSGFETPYATETDGMFSFCENLTSLDLSSFDTSNVTDASAMFWECRSLTDLIVSSFDTGHMSKISTMFATCLKLEKLDLHNFDISNATETKQFLTNCNSLKVLQTPVNAKADIALPSTFTDRATGTEYTSLPQSSNSLTLYTGSYKVIPVTGIETGQPELDMKTQASATLNYSITPANATDQSVAWSSSDTSVAAVNTAGKVTAKSAGTAVITVKTNDGGYTSSCIITVKKAAGRYTVTFDTQSGNAIASVSYDYGEAFRLLVTPVRNSDRFIGWFTAVNGRGTQYTAGTPVTADITLHAYYIAESAQDTRTDISGGIVSAIRAQTYDGFAKRPAVTVKVNRLKLEDGVDYEVSYSDNVNAGTAAVKVTGRGNYKGSLTAGFTINPKKMTSSGFEVMVHDMVLSGDDAESPAAVYDRTKGAYLAKGTDYTVAFTRTDKAGTAKVAVTGAGNYKGTLNRTYRIFPSGSILIKSVALQQTSFDYDGTAKRPELTVKDSNGNTVAAADYSVSYRNNKNSGLASVTVKGKKTYKGSVTRYFRINAAESELVISDIPDKTYTGSQIKPRVKVTCNGKRLGAKYYTVTYSDSVEAGTAKVTVIGRGNYCDTVSKAFTINKKDISRGIRVKGFKGMLKLNGGTSVSQNITLYCGKHQMVMDRDYSVEYVKGATSGTATMKITAVDGSSFMGTMADRQFRIR